LHLSVADTDFCATALPDDLEELIEMGSGVDIRTLYGLDVS
jgi:hypothetical protein